MKAFIERMLQYKAKDLGTVVHIGAGSGALTAELCRLSPHRLLAYEASEKLCKSLERKTYKEKFVTIHNEWVLPVGEAQHVAYQYSNPRYNSLIAHEKINGRRVKLNLLDEVNIEGVSFDTITESVNDIDGKANILITSLGNADTYLIDSLSASHLSKFDFIIIDSATDNAAKTDYLENQHFIELPAFNEEAVNSKMFMYIAAWAEVQSRCNLKEVTLKEEVGNVRTENEELSSKIKKLALESEQLVNERHDLTTKVEEQTQVIATLRSELGKANQKLESISHEHEEEKKLHESELSKIKAASDLVKEEHKTETQKNQKLTIDLEAQRKQYQAIKKNETVLTNLVVGLYNKLNESLPLGSAQKERRKKRSGVSE